MSSEARLEALLVAARQQSAELSLRRLQSLDSSAIRRIVAGRRDGRRWWALWLAVSALFALSSALATAMVLVSPAEKRTFAARPLGETLTRAARKKMPEAKHLPVVLRATTHERVVRRFAPAPRIRAQRQALDSLVDSGEQRLPEHLIMVRPRAKHQPLIRLEGPKLRLLP